ncbi:MAG: dihydroorotase family protein [Kiritimatiellales bacterium]|nr:dihydroorotase family protein [Kiritimatiellales bacterium]
MSNMISLPGLIDCHVHFREPGFEHKGNMESESKAAVSGGVFTVCEMPNTNPATTSVAVFKDKVERASKISDCDIRFFFGITENDHLDELRKLWEDEELKKRCCGAKVFFDHSTGNQGAEKAVIEEAFKVCAELGIPIAAHCEDAEINEEAQRMILEKVGDGNVPDVALHSLMRPCAAEAKAIEDAINLATKYGTQLHIAHLSTAQGIELVREAKDQNVNVTCEVAPHHLFLTVDDYKELGTLAKMNPPLRTASEQQALWKGIADGTVDCIATDHAPHTLEEKQIDNALDSPSGVTGVETMLPLLLTVAAGKWPNPNSAPPNIPIFQYSNIPKLCFENPNRIFQLGASDEPRITIDMQKEWAITGSELHSKCGWTPYEGWKVKGQIVR